METQPAPKPAPPVNGSPKPKETYDWDRVPADEARRKMSFPPPKATTLSFEDFCEYYNALREMPVSSYARLYVQRWWPVLLPVEKTDQFGNIKDSFPSDVKVSLDDGPMSPQLMLQLAGVGQYKFRLNDTRRPWAQQTVVFSEFEIADRSLWNLNRAVFDTERLDLDANRNQAYIKFARSVGILPREDEAEKEQADMAQATVVESVMNDARAERARADQLQREAIARAERETQQAKEAEAKAKADAAAAITKAEESKPAAPASDLLNVVNSVATLAKSLQSPKDDSLTKYLEVQAEREKTQREREKEERDAARTAATVERKRADDLQAEVLADLRKKVDTPPPTPAAAVTPPTRRQMLEDAVAEQTLLKQLAGRGGAVPEEEKPSNIDKWLEAAPVIGPIIQSFVQGCFQTLHFGLQTWQTISYNNALLGKGEQPKPPTTMEQKPPEPGKPIPPQGPQPTAEQQAQQHQFQLILQQVGLIVGPLNRAINNSKTGDEFAESMIDFTSDGRADYDKVRNVADSLIRLGMSVPGQPGIEQFKNAVAYLFQQGNPAFYQKVATLPTFGVFLEEFYDYDKIAAEKQQQQEQA